MAEKRRRARPPLCGLAGDDVVVIDCPGPDLAGTERQVALLRLRQRWELASVLNFLHVFEPLIQSGLKMSAEEIEAALLSPNEALGRLHIAILKGLPPVSKNLMNCDAWVTAVCKKLVTWWPWVAEGENPVKPDHGKEILKYKELDAINRLLILKALCEVRAEQDDVLRYITDALKEGIKVSTFRKERIGGDDNGTSYWYDGDPVIGFRLYRETIKVEQKQKLKGKGSPKKPNVNSRWETLATNLEEFRDIVERLSSGKIKAEVAVRHVIENDIVPLLEGLQKKKERALKRKQREAMLLDGLNCNGDAFRCSRREHRPVKYTFDDFDKMIDEAIHISKKAKANELPMIREKADHLLDQNAVRDDTGPQDKDNSILDDLEYRESDAEDEDYNEKEGDHNDSNGSDDDEDIYSSDYEKEKVGRYPKEKPKLIIPLRRSGRINGNAHDTAAAGHAEMKKRLRQRPTCNASFVAHVSESSDADSMSECDEQAEIVHDSEEEL